MQSILGILYSVSQIQNFCILAWCSRFWVFFIQFPRCKSFASWLDAGGLRYFVSSFPDAEFLHLSLMQLILGILYPVSQMQNFCILTWCRRFEVLIFASSFPDVEFLHLSLMQSILGICIQFLRCRIFASYLDAVHFRYFVSSFPDEKFLHLS